MFSYPDEAEEIRVDMDVSLLEDNRGLGESPLLPSVRSPFAGRLHSFLTRLSSSPVMPEVGIIMGWIWV
jgi:hypothetical protein